MGTTPEILFRKALWAHGIRYQVSPKSLPGKPDVVLRGAKLAIFIDGDFWHGGQWRRRNLLALEDQFTNTSSKDYWLRKIRRNMQRDCASTAALQESGWVVLRFWESEIKADLEECVQRTLQAAKGETTDTGSSLVPAKSFAEFFAGIGLMRMGLESQGWSCLFANDIDPDKRQMYDAQFQASDRTFVLQDVHDVHGGDVPSVTLATASFPCNDLSVAGSRGGLEGKNSSAFWGFLRVLEEMRGRRPPLILVENVPGFLSSNKGFDLHEALLGLNRLGYTVDAFMIDAADFVPQSRERLFVVGIQNDLGPSMVAETRGFYESSIRPRMLADFIMTHPEINWSIRSLPVPPANSVGLDDILEDLPDDALEWWNKSRSEYLLNQMSPKHQNTAFEMISGRVWTFGTVFRRVRMRDGKKKSMAELRTDGIAGCLRTPRGGSGRQILFKAGHGSYQVRLLTPRECARLMGANDYNISVSPNNALFGFGDAVCVPVIDWIAQHYLNPLVAELMRGKALSPIGSGQYAGTSPSSH